ncbi:LamG-like jellyroll fold domain-containing protein [Pirellulimonas nuda]|uniref:LamG-like jellyroll fold domain-containing protein n=1 Tax=Pirellulimonas nuda TaxID=2528009 RepID=UPI0018D46DB6|nr:LamG-like jellyroll fold domain-containing protein [Pirellulimonas nuda]
MQSGPWHDLATWDNGIPDATTRAIVSTGVTVDLTGIDHVAKELVVHGKLAASENLNAVSSNPAVVAPDRLKLYYDGQLVGSVQGSQLWAHLTAIGIGGANGALLTHTGVISSGAYFDGQIDSVVSYNRALSAAEVQQIAGSLRSDGSSLASDDAVARWTFDGDLLAGDYDRNETIDQDDYNVWRNAFGSTVASPFDGADGNGDGIVDAADYSLWRDYVGATSAPPSARDVAASGAVSDNGTVAGGAVLAGGALVLDGLSSVLQVGNSVDLNDGIFPEKTISLWFNADDTVGRQVLYKQGGGGRGLAIYLEGDTLYAGAWNATTSESGWTGDWILQTGVTPGAWRHVALVLDADSGVATADKSLTADWVHVNSGGLFQVGTAADRFDAGVFTLTLTGDDPNADFIIETATGALQVSDNNAFLMAAGGGRLQFFGEEKLSFTKLAATAEVGAASIPVENVIERNFDGVTSAASDGSLNWKVGDQIVIASSSYDYADQEVRVIAAATDLGDGTTRLTLNQPLARRHYGEIETYSNPQRTWDLDLRAEVAVLNRTIRIQGDENADTDNSFGDRAKWNSGASDGVGGHVMVMGSAGQISLDAVQFDRMGQTGRLGRYPVHWHVAGDRSGDVLRNSSVTNSNNRGVTLHGTQNVLLQDNVLHDIHGHGFFMEDGAETGNRLLANIAFGIHQVGGGESSNDPFVVPGVTRGPDGKVNGEAPRSGNGESSHDTGENTDNRFIHSAAFWITNPDNTWVGNVSAGAEGTGFWFVLPAGVLGLSKDTGLYNGLTPRQTNLRQFDYNTTHSSPVGLTFDRGSDIDPGASNSYDPPTEPVVNFFTGYKHTGAALYHRAPRGVFNENRYADSGTSSFNTFYQEVTSSLFVGHSRGNADASKTVTGHSLYDGASTLSGSHFAGYAAANAHTFRSNGGTEKRTHHMVSGVSFENDGSASHVSISDADGSPNFGLANTAAYSAVLLDVDGSLTGVAGRTVVPNVPFMHDNDGSDYKPAGWNAWVTDNLYAELFISTLNPNNASLGMAAMEYTSPAGETATTASNTTRNRISAKLDDGHYTVRFPSGLGSSSAGFQIRLQVASGTPATGSATFRYVGIGQTMIPNSGQEVGSMAALNAATQNAFYRSGSDLWIKRFISGQFVKILPNAAPALSEADLIALTSMSTAPGLPSAFRSASVVAGHTAAELGAASDAARRNALAEMAEEASGHERHTAVSSPGAKDAREHIDQGLEIGVRASWGLAFGPADS